MTSTPPLNPDLERRLRAQVETWRKDLMNLDRRQKLVYFKHTKSSSLEIASPRPQDLLGQLAASSLRMVAADETTRPGPRSIAVADKTDAELVASCRSLDRQAQQVYADRGFWTLYLGLGMLQWVDPADDRSAHAPVVLAPVQLKRNGTQSPYFLELADDDVVINPALRLHLEREFSISLPSLDVDDPDVDAVLRELEAGIAGRTGWTVQSRTVMTTFSFHKEAIYRDLLEHEGSVSAHPIVQLVALGGDAPSAASFGFTPPGSDGVPIDEVHPPEDLASILDADSSQRACILAARDGRSFVMDGPPGTGKSQTIANIIAELMAGGRRVLFVSEKAAALDVVRDRLAAKGLGDFLLELHSHAATRKEVVRQLDASLTQRITARGAFTPGEKASLQSTRRDLTAHAEAMNEIRPTLGRSLFEALGRAVALQDHAHRPLDLTTPETWAGLTDERLRELLDVAGRLSLAWRPASDGEEFLWRGLWHSNHSTTDVERAKERTATFGRNARALAERCGAVDEDLALNWPMDVVSARRRISLLELLEARPAIPSDWLSMADLSVVSDLALSRRRSVDQHRYAVAALAASLGHDRTDAVELDACGSVTRPVEEDTELLWRPTVETTATGLRAAIGHMAGMPLVLAEIVADARQLGGMLGIPTERITLRRAEELGHLAALGGASALPDRAWLNPAVQAALDESMRVLNSMITLVTERRSAIEQVFTADALDADLAGLEVRFRETHGGVRRWSAAARADRRQLKSITVSGRAGKDVRERLAEAVAWQQAERDLNAAEGQHADRLGSYYQRTSTDFGRITDALTTARRAIELAGNDLNNGPLANQLGRDGQPDPRLTVIAKRILETIAGWRGEAIASLGDDTVAAIAELPLESAAVDAQRSAETLSPVSDALDHLAAAAERDIPLSVGREIHDTSVALSNALVAIFDDYDADVARLGPLYSGLGTDWSAVESAIAWAKGVRELLGGPALERQSEHLLAPVVLAGEVRARLTDFEAARDQVAELFAPVRSEDLRADFDSDFHDAAELAESMRDTCVSDIGEWDAYASAMSQLRTAGLGTTLDQLVQRRAEATEVVPSVEWALLHAWSESTIAIDPRLSRHRSAERDSLVDRFRSLDESQVQQAHISVAASCSSRRPNSIAGAAAQLIRRESNKKSRHLPIRELLARTHEIVQELKPCFMMSPLAVSQYLPGEMTFDAVIFDEASQVLPADAVNCIYRGAQLIVAGDEKQLPPTSFFAQATSDDDVDEDLDIFESVLTSCKSALPSLPLTWHYRSQHESLITYSNYRFYAPDGDALQTFPGATFQSPDLGVQSYHVNGVYRRGTTRDNPVEAEAVVDRVLFHRENHPELSMGVVTFSVAQEHAITAALERRAESEPALAGLLDDHDRLTGFFVKNLENVQGDERDLILFSVGYGPDEHGKLLMNFGPVTRAGGWRRLNVAITRARRRVEVISSFRAGEIREGANESLAHLKGYLDFAARGMVALATDIDDGAGGTESVFEEDVLAVLTSWGYDVATQVGSAGYRIDLAVRHPDLPGEYLLAVECDGAAYHSAASARDRDRLRAAVLRGLGWRLHRIWGISWYRDRAGEMQKLKEAIEAALAGDEERPPSPIAAPVEFDVEEIDFDAPPSWATAYEPSQAQRRWISAELGEVEARPALHDFVMKVLVDEAPMHRDLLYKRVRDAFGVGRIGVRIKDNIEFVAQRIFLDGQPVRIDPSGFFRGAALETVRVPTSDEDVRTIGQTPPEEIDLAVANLVRDAVTITDDDVITSIRTLFGWRRAGGDIQVGISTSIDRCLKAGTVTRTVTGSLRPSD